jgi:hypothetical protein
MTSLLRKPDRIGTFKDKYVVPHQREGPSRRKPDRAGADHDTFDLVHVTTLPN